MPWELGAGHQKQLATRPGLRISLSLAFLLDCLSSPIISYLGIYRHKTK